MNDDIETVRKGIPTSHEALNALDRLEAELTRLRANLATSEVQRTAVQVDNARRGADVEHAEAELAKQVHHAMQQVQRAERAEAEVERLRAQVQKGAELYETVHQENERLRTEADRHADMAAQTFAEKEETIEELFGEVIQAQGERDRLREENESLREELVAVHNALAEYVQESKLHRYDDEELDRLREEVERLREDGIIGRDTAYRRRDAAEAEVKLLREELEDANAIVDSYIATGPTNPELRALYTAAHNDIVELRAENERLREWSKDKPEAERRWRETEAENERLREGHEAQARFLATQEQVNTNLHEANVAIAAERDDAVTRLSAYMDIDGAGAEVERLRAFGEAKQNLIDRYQAEVETLKQVNANLNEANASVAAERDDWKAEIERLRADLQLERNRRTNAEAEVERLRLRELRWMRAYEGHTDLTLKKVYDEARNALADQSTEEVIAEDISP